MSFSLGQTKLSVLSGYIRLSLERGVTVFLFSNAQCWALFLSACNAYSWSLAQSIGESLLTSLFTFFIFSRIYELNSNVERADYLNNLCNFQLIKSNIEGSISHLKLRNCWVAKKVMSHTFFVKLRVFKRGFFRNHSVYRAQLFRDNWNCYALSIFRGFILLASSDYEEHMLMRQKM